MWKLIHESYGTDLQLTSDEDQQQNKTKKDLHLPTEQRPEKSPSTKSNVRERERDSFN